MKNSSKRNASRFVLCIAPVFSLFFSGCGDRLLIDDPRGLNIQVAAPVFTVPAGVHNADLRVGITCATSGAVIHYTVDGSAPTDRAPRFSDNDPLGISGNETTRTIRAIAVKPRLRDSEVVAATYTVNYAGLGVPRFNPIEGVYSSDQTITISADAGAVIRYTTDGSAPNSASPVFSTPIPLSGDGATLTLTAVSYRSGMLDSSPTSATYRIDYEQTSTPNFSVSGGVLASNGRYDADLSVSLSCGTSGATIRYTTDGATEPTAASPIYSSPISISGDRSAATIKAKAFKPGMKDSTTSSAIYLIEYPVAAPVISPGTFSTREAATVTISQARNGATLYYTTDGSDPLSSSTRSEYAGSFTIPWFSDSAKTVRAATVVSGWSDSPVASASYSFLPPKLYAGVVSGDGFLYTSENKGLAWTRVAAYPAGLGWINDIEVSGSAIYVGANNGMAFSPDDGATWQTLTASGSPVAAKAVTLLDGTLYVGSFGGLLIGPPNGSSWTTYTVGTLPAAFKSNGINDVIVEGSDLYLATTAGITMRKGGSWSHAYINPASTGSTENYVNALCRMGRFLMAATSYGIFSSSDDGATWTKNTLSATTASDNNLQYNAIASYDSYVYAGQYRGADAGGNTPTWTKIAIANLTWESSSKSYVRWSNFGTGGRGIAMANGTGVPIMKIVNHNWYSPGVNPPYQITAIAMTP